jgi:hypothetical protein
VESTQEVNNLTEAVAPPVFGPYVPTQCADFDITYRSDGYEDDSWTYTNGFQFQLGSRHIVYEDPREAMRNQCNRMMHPRDAMLAHRLGQDYEGAESPNSMKPEVESAESSVASSVVLTPPRTPNPMGDCTEIGSWVAGLDDTYHEEVAPDSDSDNDLNA